MVHYSRDAHPVQSTQRRRVIDCHDKSKRFGTYFPSKLSFNTKWNFADDDLSTWEFCAPVAPSSRSSSSSTSGTASSTPAQEIIIRYRAGLSLDSLVTRSSSPASDSPADSGEIASLANASPSFDGPSVVEAEKDLKATYRQSRLEALEDTVRFRSVLQLPAYEFTYDQRDEAMAAMKKYGMGEHDILVCHRPGCRDTLRDVKALMFHLHIHNIHDQYV
jgi:hypothetical protein